MSIRRSNGKSLETLLMSAIVAIVLLIIAPTSVSSKRQKIHSNVTKILDNLLTGYDSRLRPGYGGPPAVIKTDINIRSMGPISEADMTYSMDAYFRQTWVDKRLQFPGPHKQLAVHIKLLELIWKPDTFFYNGKGSYLHTITTPNKLLRIKKDGTILYSMRLTIKANCPMYLHYFPVDEQSCPLQFGSYAYTRDQVEYVWQHGPENSIKTAAGMRLSQFDLGGHPAYNQTVKNRDGNQPGEFSTLVVNFRLQRHMGYFLIQVYVPCTLIVVLSWVSFWINREATADRIGLGITTVLTLTTLSMDTRDDLPKVHYATALDWFVLMCFGFVIATILEYAGVHYFTKIGSGEVQHYSESDSDGEGDLDWEEGEWKLEQETPFRPYTNSVSNHVTNHMAARVAEGSRLCSHGVTAQTCTRCKTTHDDSCLKKFMLCLRSNSKYRKLMMIRSSVSGVNSVSKIDKVSRILFPLSFIILNVLYWISYTR